tara:strand:+ start:2775 stop:3848 length:1074 start_codon:yes stop_codon:yes gene_type:complete
MKNIITVVGARPNFMKVAPFLRVLKSNKEVNSILVHTGQHYDDKMSDIFFKELDISKPDYNLNVGSGSHGEQTSKIIESFEKICLQINPNLIIVVGDINSTMACSLVAKKNNTKLIHIEAGLRSFDKSMPEEINRLVTDSIADYFFITEKSAEKNLLKEGHDNKKIFFIGNLMIDSLYYGLKKIEHKKKYKEYPYGVVTLHRPSNVDNPIVLKEILNALSKISDEIPLFFSIHPRTKEVIEKNSIKLNDNIFLLDALPYLDFLHLTRDSKVIFTDSGGIQEESTVLKIPCYTLRNNTERPITITQGTNYLAGNKKSSILDSFNLNKFKIKDSYSLPEKWDGKSSERLIESLKEILNQ